MIDLNAADDPIASRLASDPERALTDAAAAVETMILGHLGECVAVILLDHTHDTEPDPNIHELAYTVLTRAARGDMLSELVKHAEQYDLYRQTLPGGAPPTRRSRDIPPGCTCVHAGTAYDVGTVDPHCTHHGIT